MSFFLLILLLLLLCTVMLMMMLISLCVHVCPPMQMTSSAEERGTRGTLMIMMLDVVIFQMQYDSA